MSILRQPEQPTSRRRWRVKKWQTVVALALLGIVIATGLYLNSDAFQERVRRRIVTELENVTGGEVELKSFSWDLAQLQFVIEDLTIHGLEASDEVPYAHIDRLVVRLKILSFMSREVGLNYVGAERPVIHLIVYPDGSTNQPVPKVKRESQGQVDPVEQVFALQMDQFELKSGEVLFNDRRMPLNFSGENVTAGMSYAALGERYDGSINIGRMLLDIRGGPPLPSSAEIRFSLFRTAAELKSLRWSSPRSNLEASGRLSDFNSPRIELTYNASLDVAELGGVADFSEIRSGIVQLNGSGNYSGEQLASSGKLLVRGLSYRTTTFTLPSLNAGAQFSLTRERVSLSNIFATAFGGTLTGSLDVHNWLSSEQAGKGNIDSSKNIPAPPQRGSGSFAVRGIQMRAVLAALGRNASVEKLDPVGIAQGKINLAWTGSPANADAQLALTVAPPPRVEPDQFALQAEVLATYRGRTQLLDIERFELVTQNSALNVAGELGARDSLLQVNVVSRDIAEFRPLIAALAPQSVPQELGGAVTFRGTVRGRMTAPAIEGRFQAENLRARLANASPEAPPIQWDSVAADVSYSQQGAAVSNAQLRRGNTTINVSGDVALARGVLAPDSQLNARVQASGASMEELEQLAGLDLPLTGSVDFNLTLAGTRAAPQARGRVRVNGGDVMGEPYKFIAAELELIDDRARITELTVAQNGGRITGQLLYDLSTRQFHFDLGGSGFDLAHFRQLQAGGARVSGKVRFEATGSGTLDQPIINARLEADNLAANGEPMGKVVATAVTRGRELQLNAQAVVEEARLTAAGTVDLRGQFPADITLTLADFDFDPFLRAFYKGRLTGHSLIAGTISLRGPLKQPRALTVQGNIERLNAEIENLKLSNQGPLRFAMRDQVMQLEQFRIVGDGTDFSASGSVGLAQPRPLDLRAEGRINLRVLQSFNPEVQSSGITTIAATVRGTMANPSIVGQVDIADGDISLIDLPNGLSDINGTLVFDEDRLQLQSLRATTGGGELQLGGFITYARVISFNLTAQGQGIRVRYPEGVSSVANADLRFSGNLKSALLSGDVTVTRFGMTPRFDFALYLARSRQPTAVPDPTSVLNNIRLDVRVTSAPELQFQTTVARLSGDVDLRIRGTAAKPAVLGRVTLAEGDISFNGTTYHLEHGDVAFTSPVGIEPVVNVTATARVREYDITLGFHGPASRMTTTYRSEPPLPVGDIIALLAFGRTREDAALQEQQSPQSITETASNAILGQALNATLSQRAQRLFGISRIKIDPQVGGPEANPNARVTIEQQVSDWVTLTYITNLARSAEQIIQAEFIVNQNVSLLAVRDQNGVVGFDIRVRHRRR